MKTISERQVFQDGIVVFLDYISRQLKKNPDYNPHPIIRALMCAVHDIDKAKNGETAGGVSVGGTKDRIHEAYAVMLQKHADGIEVKEIRNLNVGKRLPTDAMIYVFRLQIQLDRIEGDLVGPGEAVKIMNKVIPGNRFFLLGDKWKEALEEFERALKAGEIYLPPDHEAIEETIKKFFQIPKDTPWEDYPNDLRAFIGSSVAKKYYKSGAIVITTPDSFKFEKYKVFEMATEFLIGQFAENLRPNGREG
jgi:hypothetical protein